MRILPISAIMLLAMSSMSASALAVTTTPAPVKVTSCTVMFAATGDAIGVPGVTLTNGVAVVLANESGRTVKSVTVTGDYHGRHETATAPVNLAPGATVMLTRHFGQSAYVGPDAKCAVISVTFADGTTWP